MESESQARMKRIDSKLRDVVWKSVPFQDGMPLTALTGQAIEEDSIDPEMIAIFAAKTTAERLRVAWGMWRSARRMIERIVAAEHPDLPKSEQDRIVAQRMSHGT